MVRVSASRFLAIAGVVTAAPSLVPGPVLAQERENWHLKPPGRFRLGPFYLTPRFELRNAGVDTNVFNELAQPVTDTTVVLRPSLAGALPVGRRIRLRGDGYLDLNYFRSQGTERSTDFGADGSGELDFGPFTFFGGGGGLQARQRASIDLDERIRRQERFGAGGLDTWLGRTLRLTVRGEKRQLRYASSRVGGPELPRALDRDSLIGAAELRSKLSVFTTAVATAEVIEDTFVRERDAARLTRSYRLLGGVEIFPGAVLSGTVMAGVRRIPGSSAGSVSPYTGPALRVATRIPVRGFARLSLLADRDVHYAVTALRAPGDRLRSSYISNRYEGGLDLELPFGFLGRGTVGFQNARYLIPRRGTSVTVPRVDHLYSATGTLLRRLGDSTRVGATLSWVRRVSTLDIESYEGLRYGLTAEVTP